MKLHIKMYCPVFFALFLFSTSISAFAQCSLESGRKCVNFESVPLGTQFDSASGYSSGDDIFVENCIPVSIYNIQFSTTSVGFEYCRIDNDLTGFGDGNTMKYNNVNLLFDFESLGYEADEVSFEIADLGGIENISVNDTPVFIGEITTAPLNIATDVELNISSISTISSGYECVVTLTGPIRKLLVGGQEFWIDNICANLIPLPIESGDFSPTKMVLSIQDYIAYEFNGSVLSIPVTVEGVSGSANFLVFTKDQANSIGSTRNGFLGWHYINKIDTCIYISPDFDVNVGANTVNWNGRDDDGNVVPPGEYTYYIYAFDNIHDKIFCAPLEFNKKNNSIIRKYDPDGNALVHPVINTSSGSLTGGDDPEERIHYKWSIGYDPADVTILETTSLIARGADNARIALDPYEMDIFYKATQIPEGMLDIKKYKWVPNGETEIQVDWGDDSSAAFFLPSHSNYFYNSLAIIDDTLFALNSSSLTAAPDQITELVYIDREDGTETKRVDLSDWWIIGNAHSSSDVNGPLYLDAEQINKTLCLVSWVSCVSHMMKPFADDDDLTSWLNLNGDCTGDKNCNNYSENCYDPAVGPYKYNVTVDINGFSIFPSGDIGAVSYGLFAPDGTGMGYKAYAHESDGDKFGNYFIDSGSAFDGIYTDNNTHCKCGWWYVAYDSVKGTIGETIAVTENAPAIYSVDQNSPNPFNPSTTINYTIAEAGNVSVTVYNTAGQKIDTLMDGFMDAGSHSVVWDASDFSAGVYFYTVKIGEFTKTLKMTLIK